MANAARTAFFDDVASRATLRAAARAGRIKQLAPGLWPADLHSDPEVTVAENRWSIDLSRKEIRGVVYSRDVPYLTKLSGQIG